MCFWYAKREEHLGRLLPRLSRGDGIPIRRRVTLCFFQPGRNMTVVEHGDDFNTLGVSDELSWYEEQLKQSVEIEIRGRMGTGGNCDEIKILNRKLRLTPKGLTYKFDPRHVD